MVLCKTIDHFSCYRTVDIYTVSIDVYCKNREKINIIIIIISHATATWLGLMKVLCPNKVPRIKRQVASVSKKAREPADSNNSNSLSGPEHPPKVKYFYNNKIMTPQHPPKVKYSGTVMVKQQQDERPTSQPCSHGRKHCRGKPVHREEEDQVANKSVEFQLFQVDAKGATSMGGRQSMLPRRISTPSQSEIKSASNNHYCGSTSRTSTPSQSEISGSKPNDCITSHRRTKKPTTSTLRVIFSATKTHRTLLKPPPPRSLLSQRSTPSSTNLAQSRSAV